MSNLTRYKYVKYDTGDGYIREGLEPHNDGTWYKADDVARVLKDVRDTLENIVEYWNGNQNERAMVDALEHHEREAQRLLKELTS